MGEQEERNKGVVRRIEEAWNSNTVDALDELMAADFRNNAAPPGGPQGLAGAKLFHQQAMISFPDRQVTMQDIVAEGDKVAVRSRVRGTNKGGVAFLGVEANDRPVDFEWVTIYRLEDGKVVESWGLNDVAKLMTDLGVMPAPGGGGGAG